MTQVATRRLCWSALRIEPARFEVADEKSHALSHIPFRPHQTRPTPLDGNSLRFKSIPTPRDHSDGLQPPHNPSVVGSIPTGPTMSRILFQGTDLRGSKQAEIPPQQRVGTPRSSLSLLCLVGPTVILLQGLRSMHLGNGLLISLKSQYPTLFPTPLSQVGFLWIE